MSLATFGGPSQRLRLRPPPWQLVAPQSCGETPAPLCLARSRFDERCFAVETLQEPQPVRHGQTLQGVGFQDLSCVFQDAPAGGPQAPSQSEWGLVLFEGSNLDQ